MSSFRIWRHSKCMMFYSCICGKRNIIALIETGLPRRSYTYNSYNLFLYRLAVFLKNLINMRPFARTQAAVSALPYTTCVSHFNLLLCLLFTFRFLFSVSVNGWAGLFSMSRFFFVFDETQVYNSSEYQRKVLFCYVIVLCKSFSFWTVMLNPIPFGFICMKRCHCYLFEIMFHYICCSLLCHYLLCLWI